MKRRLYLLLIVVLITLGLFVLLGWIKPIFYEQSFKGRVIDAETKKPIEGAAVVAMYNVYKFYPLEGRSSVIDVRESVTDNKGDFFIPSITRIIVPWAVHDNTHFLVWKPGYRSEYVTQSSLFKVGSVELRPIKTMDERRRYQVGPVDYVWGWKKKQKKFIEMIRAERELIFGKPAGDLYK